MITDFQDEERRPRVKQFRFHLEAGKGEEMFHSFSFQKELVLKTVKVTTFVALFYSNNRKLTWGVNNNLVLYYKNPKKY